MTGLTTKEAEELLTKYGLNTITERKKKNIFIKFIEQFNNFLTILLLAAAFISFLIHEPVDGSLILSIVVLNALFGLYQESKAEAAIQLLKKMTITKIRVLRDGKEIEIDSKYLVPGDVFFIEEGVKIPADANVVEEKNLMVNESALTGESLPVTKKNKEDLFMGTIVVRGRGFAKVTRTGMESKFGEIAKGIEMIEDSKTPLQKKLESLSKAIGILGISISFVVFVLSLLQGSTYFPAFLLAISLAVAVVPEGLPAVMTITLAIGVKEMANKKAIIRKLSAIEALGSITLIATDKTGTLTTNKMKVSELYVDDKLYKESKPPSLSNHPFSKMLLDGILCSTASLVFVHDHDQYDVLGDPTEGALLFLGQKMGLIPEMVRKEWKVVDEVPFDSVTKRMTVLVEKFPISNNQFPNKSQISNSKILFSKGAPESILEISKYYQVGEKIEKLTPNETKNIENIMHAWAKKGLRVLAFAYKNTSPSKMSNELTNQLTSDDLTFLGMVAIHDPPRPEVLEALAKAKRAGIKAVMITGDNEVTAEAIGVSTGFIKENEEILTGKQLEEYSDKDLLEKLPSVKIFARTTPFHKARIVKLYQESGEIVAVTGDGVNDAIALKQADVGVAMGLIGTDVARETADMVITDDNFATIVNAVEEGRNIIKNLKNAITYLLSCNVSEALALVIGLIIGIPNLFFAIQLLYINLVTDGVPALALAFSPKDDSVMNDQPKKEMELLDSRNKKYIFLVGLLATCMVIASYFIFRGTDLYRRTAAFSVLALIQSFIFVDLWLSHHSVLKNLNKLKRGIFLVAFIVPFILQFVIVHSERLASVFKISSVSGSTFIGYIIAASLILVWIRILKRML